MNDVLAVGITMLAIHLMWYPIARRRPPETRFLENLTFWRWVLYSIVNVGLALIVYTLVRVLMDSPSGSLVWWLVLLLVVGIVLSSWLAHWRLSGSRKKQ